MTSQRAFLVDASIYIFRAWFSLPERWHSPEGFPLNAVYGYTRFLLDFLPTVSGQPVAAAFDESLGTCFRNDLYPDYKASRELPDEALAYQLAACREVTERLGVACYGGERFEADDYLGALATRHRAQNASITLLTRDKDLGQLLVEPDDLWWDYAADVQLDAAGFTERFGVSPHQFPDYLGLVGDPVDDIPGVPGIGARTAAKLLDAFSDLDSLLGDPEAVLELPLRGKSGVVAKLVEFADQARLSRDLARVCTDVPDVAAVDAWALQAEALDNLVEYLRELSLDGPLTRLCDELRKEAA